MSIVPQPLTEFPWRVLGILLAIAGFGTLVLYSAAGGSITPWAVNQSVRFVLFSGMAFGLSRVPLELFARSAFPAYGAVLLSLVLVRGGSTWASCSCSPPNS
jgi:rod shape determining protein RodA